MDLKEFLTYMDSGREVEAGSEIHLFINNKAEYPYPLQVAG